MDFPKHWRVHPVVSIAQLEPAPKGEDPYLRATQELPPALVVDGESDHYKVEALLGRRQGGRGGRQTFYLVKWKGYGHEFNEWKNKKDLQHAAELVRQYDDDNTEDNTTRSMRSRRLH